MKQVAERSDLTESFISQIERNAVNPSLASIWRLAATLGILISDLFDEPRISARVVRTNERSRLAYPGLYTDALLSHSLDGTLEVLWADVARGGGSGSQPFAHEGYEECVVVVRGQMEIWIGEEPYLLKSGDAITFASRVTHRWRNAGRGKLEAIWAKSRPTRTEHVGGQSTS